MTTEYEDMGLTPEELAALNEPDTEDKNATQGELEAQAAAEAGNQPEGKDATDDKNKGAGGDAAGAAAAADTGAAAAGEQQPADAAAAAKDEPGQPASAAQSAPILVAEVPADADDKLKEIADKKAGLLTQFDDGDITAKEYQAQLDALNKDERAIERQVEKAQLAAEIEQQRRQNEWASQCDGFLKAHPEYDGGKGERFEHMNAILKAIAVIPQNQGLTGPQLLDKAHRLALADRGEALPAPKADAKGKQDIPKPALPPSLANVPAAASNDPGEGKWASLDKLQTSNPEAYEAALSKLSDADRDAYLAA